MIPIIPALRSPQWNEKDVNWRRIPDSDATQQQQQQQPSPVVAHLQVTSGNSSINVVSVSQFHISSFILIDYRLLSVQCSKVRTNSLPLKHRYLRQLFETVGAEL